MTDGVLTSKEAAGYLGFTPATLCVYRSTKRVEIPFFKEKRLVKYMKSDLDAWLEKQPRYKGGKGK